jgi:hypothetical protein
MPGYRLYFLTEDGHIRRAPIEFSAADDVAAQAEAVLKCQGLAAELWERGRRVAVFAAGTGDPTEATA